MHEQLLHCLHTARTTSNSERTRIRENLKLLLRCRRIRSHASKDSWNVYDAIIELFIYIYVLNVVHVAWCAHTHDNYVCHVYVHIMLMDVDRYLINDILYNDIYRFSHLPKIFWQLPHWFQAYRNQWSHCWGLILSDRSTWTTSDPHPDEKCQNNNPALHTYHYLVTRDSDIHLLP